MAVTTTNLGVITAYGDAVAAGYTGTKAEWQALMASYATVGQQAVDAKNDAVAAKNTAVSKATEATTAANTATTKANEASASAQSIAQSASQIQENTDDIDEIKNTLTALESDGVVPSAEQILTDKGVTDSVPYHYRKTGGDGADRLYDQIVGGTVNWNQLAGLRQTEYTSGTVGVTYTPVSTSTFRLHGEITAINDFYLDSMSGVVGHISGHKYIAWVSGNSSASEYFKFHQGTKYYPDIFNKPYIYASDGGIKSNDIETIKTGEVDFTFHWNRIDLTAMFGSTIADYIYSLETAHTGDGVAFFKSLFPKDYYEYNAGELKSVEGVSAHEMIGFNQWDEEWEVGSINNQTGTNDSGGTNRIRSKNYIPCLPNTDYCLWNGSGIISFLYFYDENKNFISIGQTSNINPKIDTTPANCHYMRFRTNNDYGTTYKNDICINLSDPARNGEYEPYEAHSYPLDSTLTLRGLFKLDANNNLYADGDTYDADGTVTRKYGIVDLGTLTDWAVSDGMFYSLQVVDSKNYATSETPNLICSNYATSSRASIANKDKVITMFIYGNGHYVMVKDSSYNDVTAFKTAMSGVMLVYELATPTTEEAVPYQHLQQCDPNGTEEYVSTGIVPIGHNSFYPENLRAKIEQLPWNFASLIAPTESTFTATRNYTTGALFIVQNVLYKATSNIANGGAITPNTNCTATTLAEIISALA